MPNRMLRDWTDSDKVNILSVHAERFFVRLIMKVDDYGVFPAHTGLLKANLFPLLLDGVREADISRWMAECQKAGLIVFYEANSKKYVQIMDFKQRLDKARSKYPLPTVVNDCPEVVNDYPAEREEEVEVEKEVEVEREKRARPGETDVCNYFMELNMDDFTAQAQAVKFINYYSSNGWKVGKNSMKDWRAAARGWKERMKDFKNSNNGTHQKLASTSNKHAGVNQLLNSIEQKLPAGRT